MTRRKGRQIGPCANADCKNHRKVVTLPAWRLCANCNKRAERDREGPEARIVIEARLKKLELDDDAGRLSQVEYAGSPNSGRLDYLLTRNQFRHVADRASEALSKPYCGGLGALGRTLRDITSGAGELNDEQRRCIEECDSSPVSPEHSEHLRKVFSLVDILENFDGLKDGNGNSVKMAFLQQARLSTYLREPPSLQFASKTLWRAFCAAARLQPLVLAIPSGVPRQKSLVVLKVDGRIHQWVTISDSTGGPATADRPPIIWAATQTTATAFKSAWENEIIGLDMTAGCVYRACHHFNSGLQGDVQISVSQDGKFVAFTSDWMGTLGADDGQEPILGKNCRSDWFVVRVS